MNKLWVIVMVLGLLAGPAFGQAERSRQRARSVSNPTNSVDGTLSSTSSTNKSTNKSTATGTAASATPVTATTQQKSAAKLKDDLTATRAKGQATPELRQRFAKDLMAAARGSAKPSAYSVDKFTEVLLTSAANKSVSSAADARLVHNMVLIMNSFGISATRTQEIVSDLQSALKTAGVAEDNATAIANEFKTLALEVQTADVK